MPVLWQVRATTLEYIKMQPIIKASPHWVGSRDNPRTRTGGWLEKMANGTSSFSHSFFLNRHSLLNACSLFCPVQKIHCFTMFAISHRWEWEEHRGWVLLGWGKKGKLTINYTISEMHDIPTVSCTGWTVSHVPVWAYNRLTLTRTHNIISCQERSKKTYSSGVA